MECCKNCFWVDKHRNWLGIPFYTCIFALFDITMPWVLCGKYEKKNDKGKGQGMDITDIIGKGKDFEPPFKAIINKIDGYDFVNDTQSKDCTYVILDNRGKTVVASYRSSEDLAIDMLFAHIVELLNERWKDDPK